LKELWREINDVWHYEDGIYRFYHQSYKAYRLQHWTLAVVEALRDLAPHLALNPWFLEIVREGTGKEFDLKANRRWLQETRPIVEAFFHSRYFLEMLLKYGTDRSDPPENPLPSGWASVLYLYNLW
jgi:hypothetical protein